jgi:outer membrane protein OmpA-like peptidoglycan-associated protein
MMVALSSTGCATKKFVQEQVNPVQQRVDAVDKKQTEALASLDAKEQKDISRVEERAITADSKAGDAARAAAQADSKAAAAAEAARSANTLAQADQAKIGDLTVEFQNMDNLKLSATESVLFGLNKSALSDEAKAKLDQIVQQTSSLSRYVLEVEGFTDKTGSKEYNLVLSARRADAVMRYLVDKKVPLRRIHMLGLGVDQAAEGEESTPATRKEARRVVVKVWVGPEVK